MGTDPRRNGHDLTRLTISEGKRAEPRLMMAHPTWRSHRLAVHRTEVAITLVLLAVVAIALAGRSL
jgi:hypothetical protein